MTDAPQTPADLHARATAALVARDAARSALADAETAALLAVLDAVNGNQVAAAPRLGMSLATLKRRLDEAGYDVDKARERWPLDSRARAESP